MLAALHAHPILTQARQRDLTDPRQGEHPMQELLGELHQTLARRWSCRRQLHRGLPLLTRLEADSVRFAPRRHISEALPELLQGLALDPPDDLLLVCPGLVYPDWEQGVLEGQHQLDLWRLRAGPQGAIELGEMAQCVLRTALPGRSYRLLPAPRPHTHHSLRIDIAEGGEWQAVGWCGIATPSMLDAGDLDPGSHSVLGVGLELDRVLALRGEQVQREQAAAARGR